MSANHVIIIGAGVGGLALAQGLAKNNVPFSVYERDAFLDSRLQGYRIKIVGDMIVKLRALLTDEAWTRFEGTSAATLLGETNLNATDAAVTACRKGRAPPGAGRPYAADRGLLRKAMIEGIEDKVHFGQKFQRYETIGDGTVRAVFEGGNTVEGTLIVGADGSRSTLRNQYLPQLDPKDTGVCCIYGKSTMTKELRERFPEKHRQWITVVRDQTPTLASIIAGRDSPITMVLEPCLFSNRDRYPEVPEDYVYWGILFNKDTHGLRQEELTEKLKTDPVALSLDIVSEWHPTIGSLVQLQDKELASGMRVYQVPSNLPSWKSSANVTMLGDAVHVMSPSGGVGAVAALNDAFELTQTIQLEGVSATSIANFEAKMRSFAEACLRRTNFAATKLLSLSLDQK